MGIDTHGRLKGKVPALMVLEFIKKNIDKSATMRIKEFKDSADGWGIKEHYGDDKSKISIVSGFINFQQKDGSKRNLYYAYQNFNTLTNYEFYNLAGKTPKL